MQLFMATRCDGKSIVTVHAVIEDHKVTMTVSDEGAGIFDVSRQWSRCLRRDRLWNVQEWDLRLWKAFPTIYLSNRHRNWNSRQVRENVFSGYGSKQNEVTYGYIR